MTRILAATAMMMMLGGTVLAGPAAAQTAAQTPPAGMQESQGQQMQGQQMQGQQSPAEPGGQQAATADFSGEDVERFARAHYRIVMLQRQFTEPEQEEQLRSEAARTIRSHGMTIDQYNAIYRAARTDEEVRQQVIAEIRQFAEVPQAE